MKHVQAIFVSDIHCGKGGDSDTFEPYIDRFENELLDIVDIVEEYGCPVILNGDIFDIWKDGKEALTSSLSKKLQQLLLGVKDNLTLVCGNHDMDILSKSTSRYLSIDIPIQSRMLLFTARLGTMLITHGHEFDLVNSWFIPLGVAATRLAGTVSDISEDAADRLSKLGDYLQGNGRNMHKTVFFERMLSFCLKFGGISGNISGHTHQADSYSTNFGFNYYNTGCYADDGWMILYEDGSIRRFRF